MTGLSGAGLVLQNNAGDNLTIAQNGSFSFATPVASGGAYDVTRFSNPVNPWQTCTVSNGAGTVAAANVTNIAVSCSANAYTVGGTVSGLAGGDSIVLRNEGGDDLTVSANGSFTFATPVASGGAYSVTTTNPSSPVAQACVVTSGAGSIIAGNVSNVSVACTTTLAISPSVASTAPRGLAYVRRRRRQRRGYTWLLSVNNSGGSINPSTGAYTAGALGGVSDEVTLTDSNLNAAVATITVTAGVSISPASLSTTPRGTQTFTASGGSGVGYTWSLSTNNSGGSIDSVTGVYTAGATGSVTDVVLCTDSLGNTKTAAVTVGAGVSISPSAPTVNTLAVADRSPPPAARARATRGPARRTTAAARSTRAAARTRRGRRARSRMS